MINKNNFKALLQYLKFKVEGYTYRKDLGENGIFLQVDFKKEILEYPNKLKIHRKGICNFSQPENVVVFECVHKLLEKGYKSEHIELEPRWKLGHGASGGRADILVKNQKNKPILIIECKTHKEFDKAWKDTLDDGGQLFSYAQQISAIDFLCLYASEFDAKNNTLLVAQCIISHKDNKTILEQGDDLPSFQNASSVKERFEVWKETYKKEYTQTGIFEDNMLAYQIGKDKYTLQDDTHPVTNKDKSGKYHHFRTILRQHNIARKETAFEVLVNLFLAKIVDEEENKNNLKFYWKGFAYDNYYDFIDRLQKLYQTGMRKFLKDEVMYISNAQIDNAFWTVKNKRNATKKQIQQYFRNLKFFSNNAFSLINVHNERLFVHNTKVLVELVQMWQNLRLKTKEQNQFLGDMFEYFLDNSIKQSEGQFFTPMPITKFIVSSLPLEEKIRNSPESLKAIDFACGAGHFLTEYAQQIKPLVEQHKETEISKYYEDIIGIEKEDRLAKVAKVSAYMYGQDQIKILEKDTLSDIEDLKHADFDVLVSNPPFAVKGFLSNLDDKQKKCYELIQTIKTKSDTNNIQCFFIERAKQIMSPDGVVGIIVPSSVLSNSDATHIGTREIIIKYFDIISIVELGSGTFGKTGTSTVVLFLKRKAQRPEQAEHYANRVEDYFEAIQEDDPDSYEYQDGYLIQKYCEHTNLPVDEYRKLFGITTDTIANLNELLKTDIFIDYKKDFETGTDIKKLKENKNFKNKGQNERSEELNKRFIKYLYTIEKDKLFYFFLAFNNPQKVLIVKTPKANKEQKQFLGYEWSSAKGSEGIQYHGGSTVNDIITPLFNPKNVNDSKKINYLIQQNFLGEKPNDLNGFEQYKELITYANVTDILDFSRKDFNKTFSLSPKKNIVIDTKWELVKLDNYIELFDKDRKPIKSSLRIKGDYPYYGATGIIDYVKEYTHDGRFLLIGEDGAKWTANEKSAFIVEGKFWANNHVHILKTNEGLLDVFLKEYLNKIDLTVEYITGISVKKLNQNNLLNIKIPLPPKGVQEQIVAECEAIDQKSEKAQSIIDMAKAEIEKEVKITLEDRKVKEEKLKVLVFINRLTKNPLDAPNKNFIYIDIDSVGNGTGKILYNNKILGREAPSRARRIAREGSVLVSTVRPYLKGFSFIDKDTSDCIFSTGFAILESQNNKNLLNKFLFYTFMYFDGLMNQIERQMGKLSYPSINKSDIENFKIPVPPLSEQKILVAKIEKLEKKISQAKIIIESTTEKKQKVMDKYLK